MHTHTHYEIGHSTRDLSDVLENRKRQHSHRDVAGDRGGDVEGVAIPVVLFCGEEDTGCVVPNLAEDGEESGTSDVDVLDATEEEGGDKWTSILSFVQLGRAHDSVHGDLLELGLYLDPVVRAKGGGLAARTTPDDRLQHFAEQGVTKEDAASEAWGHGRKEGAHHCC